MVMAAVAGMDTIPNQLLIQLAVALAGLALMLNGADQFKSVDKRPQNRYN